MTPVWLNYAARARELINNPDFQGYMQAWMPDDWHRASLFADDTPQTITERLICRLCKVDDLAMLDRSFEAGSVFSRISYGYAIRGVTKVLRPSDPERTDPGPKSKTSRPRRAAEKRTRSIKPS